MFANVNGVKSLVDIASCSDTGSKVNIVLYDINGDYSSGQSSGVYGFFYSKDYYMPDLGLSNPGSPINRSNQGKYFYIDAELFNLYPTGMYSTLVHEFQHMINFGVKSIIPKLYSMNSGIPSSTWFNEMMSMLCEDMMEANLKLEDNYTPKQRLYTFCRGYYKTGVADWLSSEEVVLYSYANTYAFGCYLARNYGGAELLQKIAKCPYTDQLAITYGLSALGFNETFNSVYEKYLQALVFNNLSSDLIPSFNKTANSNITYNGYNYPMTGINLFELRYVNDEGEIVGGPSFLPSDSRGQTTLRPYGLSLHKVGSVVAGKTTITFSEPLSSVEKVYLLVQPSK